MSVIDNKLSTIFDIEPISAPTHSKTVVTESEKETQTDYEYARSNIKELIRAGSSAIDSLADIARASEHPRAFEVFSGLIKNIADLNKDLLDIQAKNQQITGSKDKTDSNINVNQAVFVGSTKELIQLIKKEENLISDTDTRTVKELTGY